MALKSALQNLRTLGSDHDQVKEPPSTVILPDDSAGLCSFEDINFSDDEDGMESTFVEATPHETHTPLIMPPNGSLNTNSLVQTPISNPSHLIPSVTTPTQPISYSNNVQTPIINNVTTALPSQLSTSIVINRQIFPGPAGRLPILQSDQSIDNVQIRMPSPHPPPSPMTTPRRLRLSIQSPCTNAMDNSTSANTGTSLRADQQSNDFSRPPWATMMQDLEVSDLSSDRLTKFTLAYVKRQAINQQLVGGKVAHLRVLVKSFTGNIKNVSALVKDETGEMLATVHMSVWDLYKDEWSVGCCMILRQVSIISPTPRKHYLNITLDNIVRLYSINNNSFSNPQIARHIHDTTSHTCHRTFRDRTNQPSVETVDQSCSIKSSAVQSHHNGGIVGIKHTNPGTTIPPKGQTCIKPFDDQTYTGLSQDTRPPSMQIPSTDGLSVHPVPTDIEDDFDAFFNDIDASVLDI